MRISTRTILAVAALMLLGTAGASAQTKKETKQYGKAVGAGTVAAYDKFLAKFPSSVYAQEIAARKDTLLNISPYDALAAEAIARQHSGLDGGVQLKAFARRKEGMDYVTFFRVDTGAAVPGEISMTTLQAEGGAWKSISSYELPAFESEEMASQQFVDDAGVARIRQKDYIFFNVLMSSADGGRQAYVAASFCPEDESFQHIAFIGKNIRTSADSASYRIQGRQDIGMQSGASRPEMQLMSKQLADNPALVAVSDADYLTDEAMEFWLKNNPDALTSATKVAAATLPAESSLVEAYTASKGKKSNGRYSVGMFDFRGYTVIVVYQKASDDYILLWVEPECKDHKRDRLLNSISFTGDTTLEMFYYHGSRTFKYHLNVASKSLQRR